MPINAILITVHTRTITITTNDNPHISNKRLFHASNFCFLWNNRFHYNSLYNCAITYLGAKNLLRKYKYPFGTIKPIDPYQELAMDSLKYNQITLLKGPAGTGKSLLSLAYLFKLLEENKIDRIIIFCNTVATAGSAKLGFYPGDRT